jgi:hypothetical protein
MNRGTNSSGHVETIQRGGAVFLRESNHGGCLCDESCGVGAPDERMMKKL